MSKSSTQQKNVPELRFPEFSAEWTDVTLNQVANFFDNKRVPLEKSDRHKRSGGYPYYGASGIIDYIDDYIFDGEYVLLGEDGANILLRSTRLAFLVSGKFWVNNHAHVLQSKEGSNYFLAEYLESIQYHKYNTGTAQPKLNAEICKKIRLNIPQAEEQSRISEFLSSIDIWIDNLKAQKSKLEEYKRGMMQKIFSQEVRFKDENGNNFPNWEEKRLDEVFDEVVDKVDDRVITTYSISAGKGWVSQKEKFGRDISGRQNEKYTVLQINDFSYNKGNSKTYKYGCIYPNNTGEVIAVPNVFISFRPASSNVSTDFYAMLFENHFLDRGLRRLISSGARMDGLLNVNKQEFFKLKVPVPHYDEQQKIANFLVSLNSLIGAKSKQIEKAEAWKRGLLQKMFV